MKEREIAVFWFRRDLRLEDNRGLEEAMLSGLHVLPVFIVDERITNELEPDDARLSFIHSQVARIHKILAEDSSGMYCLKGNPEVVWNRLISEFTIKAVYATEDYEPYAISRDKYVSEFLNEKGIDFHLIKDQVIFAKGDVLKADGTPYTVFTPYKNKWLEKYRTEGLMAASGKKKNFYPHQCSLPSMDELGFKRSTIQVLNYNIDDLDNYEEERDIPSLGKTSMLSPHLRFGTVSIRHLVNKIKQNQTFLSELIWREFFMQILWHFPHVVSGNFRKKYDYIPWRNNPQEFEKWKNGQTGYPMVDAGIRELNTTGYMHNRVRMVVAGFLCKHLLIDWRWGEAYFASKLLDFELSSNNGNWQWAAGTGCDAAPYFRVFNPATQLKKFDPGLTYVKRWVPEFDSLGYARPLVEHKTARLRAIETYKRGIEMS